MSRRSDISVVIPAFNAEASLGAAVESCLEQCLAPREVIVVDDGSQDATVEVARRYGESVTVVQTRNRGVSAARNTGIELSSGRYVAFLDADDRWLPGKLVQQMEAIEQRQDSQMCTTGTQVVDDAYRPVRQAIPPASEANQVETLLLRSMVLGHVSSVLVERELAQEVGFDTRLSQCADWDFFLRIALQTRIASDPDPLLVRVEGTGNMSRDIDLLASDTMAALDLFFSNSLAAERYGHLKRRAYAIHWMIISGSYSHAGQLVRAVRAGLRGLGWHPGSVRTLVAAPLRRLRRPRTAH